MKARRDLNAIDLDASDGTLHAPPRRLSARDYMTYIKSVLDRTGGKSLLSVLQVAGLGQKRCVAKRSGDSAFPLAESLLSLGRACQFHVHQFDEVAGCHVERPCELEQRRHRWLLLPKLQLRNIVALQIGIQTQLFLSHLRGFSQRTQRLPESLRDGTRVQKIPPMVGRISRLSYYLSSRYRRNSGFAASGAPSVVGVTPEPSASVGAVLASTRL